MTTPVVLAVSEALANSVTSLDVPTPTGTASGDLLLVIVAVDAATRLTSMSGFTALYENEVSETFITASAYYRVADGTEGANLTVTLSGTEDIVARAYRVDGYSGTPEVEYVSTGNSTTQTSPPITPSGGSADYLYLVFDHIDTANGLINTFPAGYTGTGSVVNTRCRLGYGVKSTIATTSETPTDWVLSATRRTVTSTIAISPVSGGGAVTVTGQTPNYLYAAISASIDLTGSIDISGSTPNYTYDSISGNVDLTGSIDVLGNTPNYNYLALTGQIDLTGQISITGNTVNYPYAAISGNIDFTGVISIVGATASYNYQSINGFTDLTGEITISGQTANYSYSAINGSIELGALISVIGNTPDYNYQSIDAVVTLVGEIQVNGSTPNYSYQAISGTVGTGEVQVIGKVTANFKADLYSSGFKPSEITVTFKQ